jgi:hypothetical protein
VNVSLKWLDCCLFLRVCCCWCCWCSNPNASPWFRLLDSMAVHAIATLFFKHCTFVNHFETRSWHSPIKVRPRIGSFYFFANVSVCNAFHFDMLLYSESTPLFDGAFGRESLVGSGRLISCLLVTETSNRRHWATQVHHSTAQRQRYVLSACV